MLETIAFLLLCIFFIAWCSGVIERQLFSRFIWKEFPEVAAKHFPGVLKGSIHQQMKTAGWLWNRTYTKLDEPRLTERANLHRKVSFTAIGIMLAVMLALLLVGAIHFAGDISETAQPAVKRSERLD